MAEMFIDEFSDNQIEKIKDVKIRVRNLVRALSTNLTRYSGVYVAGGTFVSLFRDEPIKDIDIFVTNAEAQKFILEKILIRQIGELENPQENLISKLAYAALGDVIGIYNLTWKTIKYQFIFYNPGSYANMIEALNCFDYVHNTAYYDIKEDKFNISPAILYCIEMKLLQTIDHTNLPGYGTADYWSRAKQRQTKFLSKGWSYSEDDLETLHPKLRSAMTVSSISALEPGMPGMILEASEEIMRVLDENDGFFKYDLADIG